MSYTHQNILNGLPVTFVSEHRGMVIYDVPWSVWPRRLDSTNFHRYYQPIEEAPDDH